MSFTEKHLLANPDLFQQAIVKGLSEAIGSIVDEEVEAAKRRIEARIREKRSVMVMSMLDRFEVSSFGQSITIRLLDERKS